MMEFGISQGVRKVAVRDRDFSANRRSAVLIVHYLISRFLGILADCRKAAVHDRDMIYFSKGLIPFSDKLSIISPEVSQITES